MDQEGGWDAAEPGAHPLFIEPDGALQEEQELRWAVMGGWNGTRVHLPYMKDLRGGFILRMSPPGGLVPACRDSCSAITEPESDMHGEGRRCGAGLGDGEG